jgi:hypothetical protein
VSRPEQGYAKLARVTRRALLIGSETYGLGGCDADVELMRQVLAARAFDAIDVRTGADASRAGIIDGLEKLIAAVKGDDAVVLYYSGHGGRVTRPDFEARKAAGLSVYFQFIVPFDMSESETGDFRGLLSEELTQYQRRMTEAFRHIGREPNVTTILDCCHSGYMARDLEAKQKSIDVEPKMFRMLGIREHLQQLGAQAEIGGLATNPDAVRLVACQPEQSAYEMPSKRGGRHGTLTDALASVLEELGPAPVSWGVVGDLVRRRVRALMPEQRPDVEGPPERLVFSSDSVPVTTAMPVASIDGVFSIEAAEVVGIGVGDQFQLLAPGGTDPVGTAVVSGITGGNAVLKISPGATWNADTDVVAVPTRISVPKALVHLDVADGAADELGKLIDGSNHLAVSDEVTGVLARIARTASGGLVVLDQIGAPWRSTEFTDDSHGHADLVQVLDAIAVGQRLADLPSGQGPSALDAAVVIDFGTVDGDVRTSLPPHGAQLTVGSHVFLDIRNTSTEALFAWVFDIGVSGRSSQLTNAASSGTTLDPTGGEGDTLPVFDPAGNPLFWPDDVPTTPASATPASAAGNGARTETFVILLADQRSDLSSLASPRPVARGDAASPLDVILDEVRTGTRTREIAPAQAAAPPLRYRLERVEFLLVPDQKVH